MAAKRKKKRKHYPPQPDPPPDEIERMCDEIQHTWPPEKELARGGRHMRPPVPPCDEAVVPGPKKPDNVRDDNEEPVPLSTSKRRKE